ncbi:MAG: LysM peptidoglycan-binding domain-containing protein, partial [Cyanobacteria bacterium J06636_28]
MKRANSQEPKSETSHSCFSDMIAVTEQVPSGNTGRSKSAAMLGLALSFGASGVLFADGEATAAVGSFVTTTSAASSESPQLPSVLNNQLEQPSNGQRLAVYHTVEQGDSLWQIAQEHRVEIQDIKTANRISPDAPLQVGQVIKVPNEESTKPTLVSLLPGVQNGSTSQAQKPSLERLVAGIASDSNAADDFRQAAAPTTAKEESAVVTTEELTGDISLRSAGLVSQADGFQTDLEQLASSNQGPTVQSSESIQTNVSSDISTELPIAEPDTPEPLSSTDATDAAYPAYEVRQGDTVGDIAVALGTTSEEIAEVNGLEDPDFIVEGDTLALPEDVVKELTVDCSRLKRVPSKLLNEVDAANSGAAWAIETAASSTANSLTTSSGRARVSPSTIKSGS